MSEVITCGSGDCSRPARMAITTRPTRENLHSVIYYDNRTAPKAAQRYCKQHGQSIADGLISVMVDADEETKEVTPQ